MYLFYFFILCDTSLILAIHQYYSYDVENSPCITLDKFTPVVTEKRESGASYTEFSSSTPIIKHADLNHPANESKQLPLPTIPTIANTTLSSRTSASSSNVPLQLPETLKKPIASQNGQYSLTPSTETSATNEATKVRSSILIGETTFIYPEEINNDTLKKHNITSKSEDSHIYYSSWRQTDPEYGKHYWVDMSNRTDVMIQPTLSNSHRRAVTVGLPFKFKFYGQEIENVTIATGGFLYTGDYIHSWLAATQYIAPLMANFDTSLSNDSFVKYVHNDTTFTVLWENVTLQDRPDAGNFTFEVTLCKNGDIIFVYKNIPNITNEITEEYHPVKVGLSDAYVYDNTVFFVRRKTIFEYHRIHFDKKILRNWTVIYLRPIHMCQNKTTCELCLSKDSPLECQWCDGRCSTGIDRKRQDWIKRDCEKKRITVSKQCSLTHENVPTPGAHKAVSIESLTQTKNTNSSASVISLLMITVACISGIFIWTMYAYRNPHSASGQILIRYRPSRWSGWRKGEARYTAATIHM